MRSGVVIVDIINVIVSVIAIEIADMRRTQIVNCENAKIVCGIVHVDAPAILVGALLILGPFFGGELFTLFFIVL